MSLISFMGIICSSITTKGSMESRTSEPSLMYALMLSVYTREEFSGTRSGVRFVSPEQPAASIAAAAAHTDTNFFALFIGLK